MRVRVIGEMPAAAVLRGYLVKDGTVALAKEGENPDVTITLEIGTDFYFDSIDCPLEASIFRHVRDLAKQHIEIRTKGGIQADNAIKIVFPESESRAIELGVFHGFVDFAGPNKPAGPMLLAPAGEGDSAGALKSVQDSYERLLQEKDSGHARVLGEVKAAHAAVLSTVQEQLAAEKAAPREDPAAVQRLLDEKQAGHERTVAELKAAHETTLAELNRRVDALTAERSTLLQEIRSLQISLPSDPQAQKDMYERLLADRQAASDGMVEALKNTHAATVQDAEETIQSLTAEVNGLRDRLSVAVAGASSVAQSEDFHQRLIAEIKAQHSTALAERDAQISALEAKLKAAQDGLRPGLVESLEARLAEQKATYERMLAERSDRISALDSLANELSRKAAVPPTPWYKRIFR